MKKHLIAAAVAGALAVPAMAQVTIKGTFDVTGYNTSKVETTASSTATAVDVDTTGTGNNNGWSTSEIRFEGSEDLGGGLKASFALATGLSGGTSTFADRDRFIGLAGGFGSIRMGRFVPAAATGFHGYTAATTNAAGTTYQMANGGSSDVRLGDDLTAVSLERNNNNLQYTSPAMSGFVVNVNYGSSGTDTNATLGEAKTTQTGVHLGYSSGPISVGFASNKKEIDAEGASASANGITIEGNLTWLGGSYNLGMATVGFAHVQRDDETTSAAGVATKDSDIKLNILGVTVPMGATTFRLSYYTGENEGAAGTTDDFDLNGYQLSALYALSKRTSAYFVMGKSEVERAGTNTGTGAREESTSSIGITHSF